MSEIEKQAESGHDEARREFLRKAGTVAVTLPAVALLLKASDAKAWGFNPYGHHDKPKRRHGRGHGYKHKKYDRPRFPSWFRRH
jgi:hypothetical protein